MLMEVYARILCRNHGAQCMMLLLYSHQSSVGDIAEKHGLKLHIDGECIFNASVGNSCLWNVDRVNILVDPILVGNLDFGIPLLYDAAKKYIKNFRLEDLPEIDCLVITQSLDDHCHAKTLKPLSEKVPELRVVSTPNAEAILRPLFRNVTYLEPSQSYELDSKNGTKITATAGPVLGPPW